MEKNTWLQQLRKDIQELDLHWQRVNERVDRVKTIAVSSNERLKVLLPMVQELTQRGILVRADNVKGTGAANHHHNHAVPGPHAYTLATRFVKIKFPQFSGSNVKDWIYKVEKVFEVDHTPEAYKVTVASMHLEGVALNGIITLLSS